MAKGKTSAGKLIGKLVASAKREAGNLKQRAKELSKQKADELEREIRARIPTEPEIKDMILEEAKTRGKPIACSIKAQKTIENIYNEFKRITDFANTKTLAVSGAITALISSSEIIEGVLNMIGTFLDLLESIVDIIDTALDLLGKAFVAFILSDFVPVPVPQPGKFSIFDAISKGFSIIYSIIDKIKLIPKVTNKVIDFIRKNLRKIIGIIQKVAAIVTKIIAFINVIKLAVEGAYLLYLNFCNVSDEDSFEDRFSSDLVDSFLENPDPLFLDTIKNSRDNQEVIEKIFNAKFEMISYRIRRGNVPVRVEKLTRKQSLPKGIKQGGGYSPFGLAGTSRFSGRKKRRGKKNN
tara:strand:- start:1965 stop:3020 length:1056 start_codon:yes stop_codon:yes gene_type:complete